jgi:hypothetical protein
MSFAENAKTGSLTADPVSFVVPGAFDAAFGEQGGVTVREAPHGEQVPSPASCPAGVVRRIVFS